MATPGLPGDEAAEDDKARQPDANDFPRIPSRVRRLDDRPEQ